MRNAIHPLVLFLLLTSLASAQSKNYWEKKDYRQWTDKECHKLLEDSPWANKYTLTQVFIDPIQTDSTSHERQPNPSIEYKVQIRSATPVRQALVRLSQIDARYDAMTAEARKAFDQTTDKFLSARDPQSIVMHVSYTATVQNDDRDLARHWHSRSTETLKNFVFLIGTGGVKVPLSIYRPGANAAREFQFVFPREYNGRPIIEAGDKSLMLEFNHPNIRGTGARVLIEFKVDKMMMHGALIY